MEAVPVLALPAQRGSFESSRQRDGGSASAGKRLQAGLEEAVQEEEGAVGSGEWADDWDDNTLELALGVRPREGAQADAEVLEGLTLPVTRGRWLGALAVTEKATVAAEGEANQHVDLLCHAVVGEMLMGEVPLAGVWGLAEASLEAEPVGVVAIKTHRRQDSGVSSLDPNSPNGVVDAAEVWSDLDSPRGRLSAANSFEAVGPRRSSEVQKQLKGGEAKANAAAVLLSPGASAWAVSHADSTLYPHDFWHWNMQTAGTPVYV